MTAISKLTIEGFKSIHSLKGFELRPLNVLIGGNGAGKSNFIDFFRMLESMTLGVLDSYAFARGVHSLFYNGPKYTPQIYSEIFFGDNAYGFVLKPSADGPPFVREKTYVSPTRASDGVGGWREYNAAIRPKLADWTGERGRTEGTGPTNVCGHIRSIIERWRVYHFHDTGPNAPLRQQWALLDSAVLRNDGSNIAPFLFYLSTEEIGSYKRICEALRMIAPYFSTFAFRLISLNNGTVDIQLQWHQKGSDFPFTAAHFSDGTLRFLALATTLLQPNPPDTIVIDEPELGLHPRAVNILRGLMCEASTRCQVIVATQSPDFIDELEPEDIIVVGRSQGATTLTRLERDKLSDWLETYSLGELWWKNVIEAGPDYE